jgi:hypothetical protein
MYNTPKTVQHAHYGVDTCSRVALVPAMGEYLPAAVKRREREGQLFRQLLSNGRRCPALQRAHVVERGLHTRVSVQELDGIPRKGSREGMPVVITCMASVSV